MTEKKHTFPAIIFLQMQNGCRHFKKLLFPPAPPGFDAIDKGFISKPGLLGLMLFSTVGYTLSFLLVKAFSVLILTKLLTFNSINHIYKIFSVSYLPGDISNWNEGILLLIFGIPNLVFLAIGMYMTRLAIKLKRISWIFRLFLSWLAFSFVVFFLSELLIASIFYKGFGIALHWLFADFYLRAFLILAGFIGIIYWSKRFGIMFLRSCPSRIFMTEPETKQTWLIWICLFPLFTGTLLLLFAFFFSLKSSIVSMLVSAIITFPAAYNSICYLPDVRIYGSKKKTPDFFVSIMLIILLVIAVRVLIFFVKIR